MTPASDRILPSMPVGYIILHQSAATAGEEEYVETMKALHRRLAAEAAAVAAVQEKARHDLLVREAQALLSSLNQFLETPLNTDQAEVEQIVVEELERVAADFPAIPFPRLRSSVEGRIFVPSFTSAAARRAATRGAAGLHELGFTDSPGGNIYESVFVVDGGAGLDLLEHCVRDRLGIYDLPHRAHIEQAAGWVFSAYNLISASGSPDDAPAPPLELCLHLTKPPSLRYDEYRKAIGARIAGLLETRAAASASLWQRKLGLGRTREFILRAGCHDFRAADETAGAILHDTKSPEFGEGGDPPAVLMKELLA